MRVLTVFLILVTCVTLVQATDDAGAEQTEASATNAAFVASLYVSLPSEDSVMENAFSALEDLRSTPNLDDLDLSLHMSESKERRTSISATFTFETLHEVLEWHTSEHVQGLLDSLQQASEEPVQLHLRGTLAGE